MKQPIPHTCILIRKVLKSGNTHAHKYCDEMLKRIPLAKIPNLLVLTITVTFITSHHNVQKFCEKSTILNMVNTFFLTKSVYADHNTQLQHSKYIVMHEVQKGQDHDKVSHSTQKEIHTHTIKSDVIGIKNNIGAVHDVKRDITDNNATQADKKNPLLVKQSSPYLSLNMQDAVQQGIESSMILPPPHTPSTRTIFGTRNTAKNDIAMALQEEKLRKLKQSHGNVVKKKVPHVLQEHSLSYKKVWNKASRNKVVDMATVGKNVGDYLFTNGYKSYTIENFRNKVIILYFWASWSMESVEMLKALDKLNDVMKRKKFANDIVILPISIDFREHSYVKRVYKKYGLRYIAVLFDEKKIANELFHINMPPTTFIIDTDCIVRYRIEGSVALDSEDIYDALIEIKNGQNGDFIEKMKKAIKRNNDLFTGSMHFDSHHSAAESDLYNSDAMILK